MLVVSMLCLCGNGPNFGTPKWNDLFDPQQRPKSAFPGLLNHFHCCLALPSTAWFIKSTERSFWRSCCAGLGSEFTHQNRTIWLLSDIKFMFRVCWGIFDNLRCLFFSTWLWWLPLLEAWATAAFSSRVGLRGSPPHGRTWLWPTVSCVLLKRLKHRIRNAKWAFNKAFTCRHGQLWDARRIAVLLAANPKTGNSKPNWANQPSDPSPAKT